MTTPTDRRPRPPAAGLLGAGSFLLVGWIGLLVPSLIRSIESTFGQTDAGMGLYYLVFGLAYAGGSLIGGLATEHLGRRVVLSASVGLLAIGLLVLGLAPSWGVFVIASVPTGFGIGGLDGGVNGLFLDLFQVGRGRALNLLHLCFSIGALTTPIVVGRLVDSGLAWQWLVIATAGVGVVVAVLFTAIAMPSGRHSPAAIQVGVATDASSSPTVTRVSMPLVLLAVAIACGVAAEAGVSNWLVRFLEAAPLSTATTGLTLFWVGLALGRLVSARLADRFDHRRFAMVAALGSAIAVTLAVIVPWQPVSIAFFAATGFGVGPIYPMIMVVAGERFPGRSAAVSGSLSSAALAGTIVYPPVMGLLSVTVGLAIAMAGNALIVLGCAVALALVGRPRATMPHREPGTT